jgi:hypothetical protein
MHKGWPTANRLAHAPSYARHAVAHTRNLVESCTGSTGHLQLAKTLEVYTHASGSAQRDAANMLEDQLLPNVPKLENGGTTAEEPSQVGQ